MNNGKQNKTEVLLMGFARLPEKSVVYQKFNGAIGISLRVCRSTGRIGELSSSDLSKMELEYLNELLCGEIIATEEGMAEIEQLLLRNFQSSLRKPVYSGIRACRQKLEELWEDDDNSLANDPK